MKRRWFQIHLSTAIALMLAVSGLLGGVIWAIRQFQARDVCYICESRPDVGQFSIKRRWSFDNFKMGTTLYFYHPDTQQLRARGVIESISESEYRIKQHSPSQVEIKYGNKFIVRDTGL